MKKIIISTALFFGFLSSAEAQIIPLPIYCMTHPADPKCAYITPLPSAVWTPCANDHRPYPNEYSEDTVNLQCGGRSHDQVTGMVNHTDWKYWPSGSGSCSDYRCPIKALTTSNFVAASPAIVPTAPAARSRAAARPAAAWLSAARASLAARTTPAGATAGSAALAALPSANMPIGAPTIVSMSPATMAVMPTAAPAAAITDSSSPAYMQAMMAAMPGTVKVSLLPNGLTCSPYGDATERLHVDITNTWGNSRLYLTRGNSTAPFGAQSHTDNARFNWSEEVSVPIPRPTQYSGPSGAANYMPYMTNLLVLLQDGRDADNPNAAVSRDSVMPRSCPRTCLGVNRDATDFLNSQIAAGVAADDAAREQDARFKEVCISTEVSPASASSCAWVDASGPSGTSRGVGHVCLSRPR